MDEKKEIRPKKSVFVQIILGLIVNFSSLAPSMSLGFSAIALPALLGEGNIYKLSENQASWFASIASIATPVGCFASGPIADRFGRKATFFVINAVCGLGWLVIATAYYLPQHQYPLLIFGRIITGLSTGLSSMPAVVYTAEISSSQLRAMLTTWCSMSFALGVLIVYIFGWIFKDNWGIVAILSGLFCCVGALMVHMYVFESPPWLITKNQFEEAKKSMGRLYNIKGQCNQIQDEIETLMTSTQRLNVSAPQDETVKREDFLKPTFYKPFLIMTLFFFFQQFSGTFVIVFYAVDIVHVIKVTIDAYLAICLVAAMRVIGAIVVSALSKRLGRRPLSFISGSGMTLTMVVIAVYLIVIQEEKLPPVGWLPLTLLMVYFFMSTLGFLTMPFAMNAELFPSKLRGLSTGCTTCLGYVFNFVIVKTYPLMMRKMGNYKVFLFYASMSLIGTIFLALFLPETKGKTLKEIEKGFATRKRNTTDNTDTV